MIFFFFQAEDGIRDRSPSRGLGDVYKRQPVIGLEIHAELLTDSKVFCTCQNEFGGSENTRVCPRCSGLPGTLPLLNQGAVRLAAKAGFALDCTVNNYSAFDRKNYFYPDLPKAYQITQFDHPICTGGYITPLLYTSPSPPDGLLSRFPSSS